MKNLFTTLVLLIVVFATKAQSSRYLDSFNVHHTTSQINSFLRTAQYGASTFRFQEARNRLGAWVNMWHTTRDEEYYTVVRRFVDTLIDRARVSNSLDTSISNYRYKDHYYAWVNDYDTSKPEIYKKEVQLNEAYIARYIFEFLYWSKIWNVDPVWTNSRLEWFTDNMWNKWRSRSRRMYANDPNRILLNSRNHMGSHWASVGMMLSRIGIEDSTKLQGAGVANQFDILLRRNLKPHPSNADAYIWNSTYDDVSGTSAKAETVVTVADLSHANHVISFVTLAERISYEGYNADFVKKFANTALLMYRPSINSFWDNLALNTIGSSNSGKNQWEWILLGRHSEELLDIYKNMLVLNYPATVSMAQTHGWRSSILIAERMASINALRSMVGAPVTVTLPLSKAELRGQATGPDSVTFKWTQTGGPVITTIENDSSNITTVKDLTEAGDYAFSLTAKGPGGESHSSTQYVTVVGGSLRAVPGMPETITLPVNTVQLDGSSSTGPAGLTYLWTQIAGPAATIHNSTHATTFASALNDTGTYTFRLQVKAPGGATHATNKHVMVVGGTLRSVPGVPETIHLPTNQVTLDGSNSTGPAGLSYLWTQLSGPVTATITNTTNASTYATGLTEAGEYSFRLRVQTTGGAHHSSNKFVTVTNGTGSSNVLRSAAGVPETITLPINSVVLDGSNSTGPAGLTYLWTQLSGPTTTTIVNGTNAIATATGLNEAGEYTFRLRVQDSSGAFQFSGKYVTVAKGNLRSVPGLPETITLPQNSIVLDGSNSTGPAGITYLWQQIAGPVSATILNSTNAIATASGLNQPGEYTFRLRVSDSIGNTITSGKYVTVAGGTLRSIAGLPETILLPTNTVELNGLNSTGPFGLTYLWQQTSGPVVATIQNTGSASTMATGLTATGEYAFSLRVEDALGDYRFSTKYVKVKNLGAARLSGIKAPQVDTINNIVPLLFSVNPNPVDRDATISIGGYATGKVMLMVHSINGKLVLTNEFVKDVPGSMNKSINLSNLQSGVYIISLSVGNRERSSLRVVKL